MKLTVTNTINFSLYVQIITGILTLYGLFINIPEKDKILIVVLGLETLVQFIEIVFYIWIAYASVKLTKMTSRRYIDWMITTPTMLISTILFLKYQEKKEEEKLEKEPIIFWDFLKNNKNPMILIVLYNFLMLVFGYIGEVNIISKYLSTPIGFYFFYKSFKIIYDDFAKKSELGKKLFTFLLSVWSLYGVAALMPINEKNISYNLLDIVSKNFYGLFLFYKILTLSN